MRGVVWLILLFTVAVVAATTLGSNDGLVSFYWHGWRTDLSLNLFVFLLIVGCVVLASVVQAVHAISTLPERAKAWRDLRKERAAQAALREALAEHHNARYGRAVKAAARALDIQRDNPTLRDDASFAALARLLGAASLHRMQDRRRRDEWLALAGGGVGARQAVSSASSSTSSQADDGLRLAAIEWALEDRDVARAQALLAELPAGVARRTQALRLKLQASRAAGDSLAALHTARLLANHGAFSELAARGLLRTLAGELLAVAHDRDQLRRAWEALDASDRRDPLVAARAAQQAAVLVAGLETASAARAPRPSTDDAAALLEDARAWLRPFWDRLGELDGEQRSQVALALIDVQRGMAPDWLPRLEAALLSHANDATINAAVGHAFAERQLWGKARRPLEQAANAPTLPKSWRRRSWHRLAELARMDHDDERVARCLGAAAELD